MKLSTKLKMGAGALAIAAVAATSAQALTLAGNNMTVTFTEPFTLVYTTPATFGELVAGANTTYSMDAAGTITPGAGGGLAGGTPSQGVFTLTDTGAGTAAVDITVDNPTAGANGYVTINAFNCEYNAGTLAGATCAYDGVTNPGNAPGTVLNVGFDITVAGSPADAATDTATYDVTILFD